MIELVKVHTQDDVRRVSTLARKIMKEHYDPIVGSEVNDHMLNKFQSIEGISSEINGGAEYYFVKSNAVDVGFVAIEAKEDYMYLSKFYLAKEFRGRGYASEMMAFVKQQSAARGLEKIKLNVNAGNIETVEKYRHFGFEIVEEIQREVGDGYSVHDYVMCCR